MHLAVELLGELPVIGRTGGVGQRPHLSPRALQEARHGRTALVVPLQVLVGRSHEQDAGAGGVDAVLVDERLGRYDVALGLGHRLALGVLDHTLAQQVGERLVEVEHTSITRDLGPDARVQQVQDGVLDTANVLVDGHEAVRLVLGKGQLAVVRVGVAQVVPRAAREGVHGVGLAMRGLAAHRAGALVELLGILERFARGDIDVHGQDDRQVLFGNGYQAALVAIDHRDGIAPVALAADEPVAQAEVHDPLTQAALGEPVDDRLHALRVVTAGHAGELPGLHHDAIAVEGLVPVHIGHLEVAHVGELGGKRTICRHHDRRDGQAVLARKLEVALVATGHGHDGASAVIGQHVIGNPDRHLGTVDGIDDIAARERAVLLAVAHRALDGRGGGSNLLHLAYLGLVLGARDQTLDELVLRCEHEEGATEERIGTRREHGDGLVGGLARLVAERELHLGTLAATDPICLHLLDALGPAGQLVEVIKQLLGVIGDLEVPLVELAALDGGMAAPARALLDLLVGEHGLAVGAPVDGIGLAICQALLVHLEEEPLAPAIVVLLARDDRAVPIVGKAHALEARHLGVDVLEGPGGRMAMMLDGGVFGRQAKGVPSDGMQHVVAVHVQVARVDVTDGVVAHMTHVDVAARVREHLEHVLRRALGCLVKLEKLMLRPVLLPFGFDGMRIIRLVHGQPPMCRQIRASDKTVTHHTAASGQ